MAESKTLKWENVLVVGKYYTVKYKYNGREWEGFGAFKQYEYGNLYFKQDNGDWIMVKPLNLISAASV